MFNNLQNQQSNRTIIFEIPKRFQLSDQQCLPKKQAGILKMISKYVNDSNNDNNKENENYDDKKVILIIIM